MRLKNAMIIIILFLSSTLVGQEEMQSAPENWFNADYETADVRGVSTQKAYNKVLKDKSSKTVIVAVIDSGVDWEHEDLNDIMWVNEDEVPGNGKDDDGNGYIDDVHGWNFIGGDNGDVAADNLEITRLYRKYHKKYKDVNPMDITSRDTKKEYAYYLTLKKRVEKERKKALKRLENIKARKAQFLAGIDKLETKIDSDTVTLDKLSAVEPGDDTSLGAGIGISTNILSQENDGKMSFVELKSAVKDALQRAIDYFDNRANAYYNPDFNPRHIVNDNYENQEERYYGNNHYEGPDASHGTHVSGIIGAIRGNDIGIDGIADNVQIMTVRAVPDGDERDKDVANAIRYAVDNGASVINMSFGKGYVWNKNIVDEAVKYAVKNDVLLVHAAGNSSQNNDENDNYPNDSYKKSGWFSPNHASTWIEVGALSWQKGENSPARFSNYGKTEVDVFAPGVDLRSTIPDNKYASFSGTSMASPVVAGVAALIRSYYPMLTAEQVKEIILTSAIPLEVEVLLPGSKDEMVPFSSLSRTGAVVNAYKAAMMAEEMKGKRKKPISVKLKGNKGA